MPAIPTWPGERPATGPVVPFTEARRLVERAATLDVDRQQLLVRCRHGPDLAWWRLGEVVKLLALAAEVGLSREPGEDELVVVDGLDLFRFDVS